ncbi:MAG: ribosome biogenesis GTPase Der [bacterium]|nr:ribosome biogenesis GTPase Der [bacterium]
MSKLPEILIMGRQNVGKSTLFNQMIRKRHAIVNDMPGLTRDYIDHPVLIDQYYYKLIDTGGLINETDRIARSIRQYILKLMQEADLILFVVDKAGLLPMDLEISQMIRKAGKKTILVVNKVDNALEADRQELLSEFFNLGFQAVVPVSAEHRNNFDMLYDRIGEMVTRKITELPEEDTFKIAVIGKPNVGKSSLINRLANEERVIVTEIPGTTRDSIDVEIAFHKQKFIFIDTAGIRKKTKIDSNIEYYSVNRAMKSIKRSQITIMLISADTLMTESDKKILHFIVNEEKPCLLAVNKWDLVEKQENMATPLKRKILGQFPHLSFYPLLFTSAKTGHNINKIFPLIKEILENYKRRISTAAFNEFVQNILNRCSPPQAGGHVKIYYGTQATIAPPRFIFFTNKPEKIRDNYKSFLINKIRETFNFTGCPLILKFRKK